MYVKSGYRMRLPRTAFQKKSISSSVSHIYQSLSIIMATDNPLPENFFHRGRSLMVKILLISWAVCVRESLMESVALVFWCDRSGELFSSVLLVLVAV